MEWERLVREARRSKIGGFGGCWLVESAGDLDGVGEADELRILAMARRSSSKRKRSPSKEVCVAFDKRPMVSMSGRTGRRDSRGKSLRSGVHTCNSAMLAFRASRMP